LHRYRTHSSIYTNAYTDARTAHRTVLYIQSSSWRWTHGFETCRWHR